MGAFPDQGVPNVFSARDFIARFYGTLATTRPQESDYTVGTTPIAIGSKKGQLLAFILSNTGGPNIAISFNPAVTITTGLLLTTGAAFSSNWYFDLELVTWPLYAISAAPGGTLHLIENLISGA